MSLAIDIGRVTAVLLVDGWHEIRGGTFNLDAYEFQQEDASVHGAGDSRVCATGFSFKSGADEFMAGPLTAILAVRYRMTGGAARRRGTVSAAKGRLPKGMTGR